MGHWSDVLILLHAAGKLFPGPHLYAGAGIVALWAVAAALVPAMQKGNDTARTVHITLNCINIGLFAWQVSIACFPFDLVTNEWKCLFLSNQGSKTPVSMLT